MIKDQQLSDVLCEFARTMVTDFPIQAILDRLVGRIVDVLPVDAAGVTLISTDGKPHFIAASNDSALRFEQLQTDLGEGPCLAAHQSGEAITIADVRAEDRFPSFAVRAVDAGLLAVFTFPLRQGSNRMGALDLYRKTTGSLDVQDMTAAQTLADVTAAYLFNAQARADLKDSADRHLDSAFHDLLTGLPNRVLLRQRLDRAVLQTESTGKAVAVLFVNLDRFKEVNDLHGYNIGDELLIRVARRLEAVLRPCDTLARLSGDEFLVLCEDLEETSQIERVAARIGAALAKPFRLSSCNLTITASVGMAFAGSGDGVPVQLLRDADVAMYQAKRKGGGRHQVIDLREHRLAEGRASLEHDLRTALASGGELRLDYQPIVTTTDGRITGVEALLRWDHPIRGLVSPTIIVAVAEQSGLISEIGRWVLETACQDRSSWRLPESCIDLKVAVNVSAHELMARGFAESVTSILLDNHTDPALIALEVTESVLLEDIERAIVVLTGLRNLGTTIALDDFGTGYSSLSYLQRVPIDTVKIAREFIAGLSQHPASSMIVSAVVDIAHLLDMTVVAEGIETIEQHLQVDSLGCDACQGFYFARPMSAAEVGIMMRYRNGGVLTLPARGA